MRISDWSSDVCSSDLHDAAQRLGARGPHVEGGRGKQRRRIVLPAEEAHAASNAELAGLALQLAAQRPVAGQPEPGGGERRQRLQQHVEGFVLMQPAEREDQRRIGRRSVSGTRRGWRVDEARKSVGEGKSVSVRLDLGGRRIITKKNKSKKRN